MRARRSSVFPVMSLPHHRMLAWCVIDGIAVFLDIPGDRYFRLPTDRNREFLEEHGSPPGSAPAQPPAFPLPETWQVPGRQCPALAESQFRLGDVAGALWLQRRVERQLSSGQFATVLESLQRNAATCPDDLALLAEPHVREIHAFERAKLLRSAADRCLPRSIALAWRLARQECRANVVLGVKLAPFAAHCWVQWRDQVLNDEVEEVLRYTPILVI